MLKLNNNQEQTEEVENSGRTSLETPLRNFNFLEYVVNSGLTY